MARPDSTRRKRRQQSQSVNTLPWRKVVNSHPPIEVLSADQVEAIHHASLRVLAETGFRVDGENTRQILADAGAEVDHATMTVRMDPAMIEEYMAHAPATFTIHARNPAHNLLIGGNAITFEPVGGPSFVSDMDRGRRAGTMAEVRDFTKVCQGLDIIHMASGGAFEPLDLPPETRHLDTGYAALSLQDKVTGCWLLGSKRARHGIDMARIAQGLKPHEVDNQAVTFGNISTNSPLVLDAAMADGLIELARDNQPVTVTPFTLSGAMAPVTIAGALTLQNAEALFGMTLVQVVRQGCPVVYGGFTSNVDMKSGAPAFGTPEYTMAAQAGGQLARRYGVPYRSSNTTASNTVDAQSAYESQMSLWGAVTGHANFIFHAAGWLEGGLTASFEKLIVDAEMLQMMALTLEGIEVSDDTLALGAIAEVGHGGHFFGAAHTLERYESAFYPPLVSDWRNFETWEEAGGPTTMEHANRVWKQLLRDYEQPPMDPAIDEELRDYVARAKLEMVA